MFAFNRIYFHDAYTSDRESCGGNVSRTKPANKFPITGSFDCIFIRWFRLTIPCIRNYAEAVFEYFDRSTMEPNKIKENDNCFLKRSLLSCNGSLKRILSFEKKFQRNRNFSTFLNDSFLRICNQKKTTRYHWTSFKPANKKYINRCWRMIYGCGNTSECLVDVCFLSVDAVCPKSTEFSLCYWPRVLSIIVNLLVEHRSHTNRQIFHPNFSRVHNKNL